MKKCPECRDQYEGDPKFCPECGTPLKTEAEQPVADTDEAGAAGRTDTPEKEPKRPGGRKWLLVAMVAVVVALAGAAVWYLSTTAPVPDLSGRTVAQATEAIEAAGLVLGEVTYDEEAEGAPGAVIAQEPESGKRASAGTQVSLTVAGPPPVAVPDLSGLDEEGAEAALIETGLQVGVVTESFDETITAGLLVSQDPEAGAEAPRDSAVTLVFSKGPEPVAVPQVSGKAQAEATSLLEQAGFLVEVKEQPSDAEKGTVIAQEPDSGEAQPGSTVTITVSTGVEMVRVPDVLAAVRNHEFTGSYEESPDHIVAQLESVVASTCRNVGLVGVLELQPIMQTDRQDPRAGTMVPKGSTVRVYVGFGG